MTELVDSAEIERIVGASRDRIEHLARAVSAERTIYILHSKQCLASTPDLRDCAWSRVLDRGIDIGEWSGFEDMPVVVRIRWARLFPSRPAWLRKGGR